MLKRFFYVLALVSLFLATFTSALLIGVKAGRVRSATQLFTGHTEEFIANPTVISNSHYIRVAHAPELNPNTGNDFLLAVWINFSKLPEPGQRIIFVSKRAWSGSISLGYALGVSRDDDAIHPIVYWGAAGGKGRWYTFPEMPIVAKTWCLFGLSLHDDRYLGLHEVQNAGLAKSKVQLLGGYDLGRENLPQTEADLLVGGGTDKFRGEFGMLGVFSKEHMADDFLPILTKLAEEPTKIPSLLSENEVKLFVLSEKGDMSVFRHQAAIVQKNSKKKLAIEPPHSDARASLRFKNHK